MKKEIKPSKSIKMKNKILLFVSAMLLSVASAFAQGGQCGDNLTWTFNSETGMLTISGAGEMWNFSDVPWEPHLPWKSYLSQITQINIDNGVTSIGNIAFQDCINLTSVNSPNSIVSIGQYAFYNCINLASFNFSNSIVSIEGYAFYNCSKLTSVSFYDNVKNIGYYAFGSCTSLTSVDIPNCVEYIEMEAFADCTALTSVTIGNNVTYIGSAAFRNTPWFNNQPDGLVYMGKVLYIYKGTMPENTAIEVRDGAISITGEAFGYQTGLISIIIPNNVTDIGYSTFESCTSLTSIHIPEGVTTIGAGAFFDCSALVSVNIPEGVTTIENGTFYNCTALTSITIPQNVTSIGYEAFADCTSLLSITSLNLIPPGFMEGWFIPYDVFNGVDKTSCVLRVPASSVSWYKRAFVWEEFDNIVGIETAIEEATISAMRIYPNPTTGKVYIETGSKIKVYNMQGVLLLETFGDQVDLSAYPQGVYLFLVEGKTKKIIKN